MTLDSHSDSLSLHVCLQDVELIVVLLDLLVHLKITLRGSNSGYCRGKEPIYIVTSLTGSGTMPDYILS